MTVTDSNTWILILVKKSKRLHRKSVWKCVDAVDVSEMSVWGIKCKKEKHAKNKDDVL